MNEIEITGIENVCDRMKELSDKAKGELGEKALQAGAEPIKAMAIALCPVKSGATKEAIAIHKGNARDGQQSVVVGTSAKFFTGKVFYSAFVELGHYLGKRARIKFFGKTTENRTFIEPKPFMRPAYEANKEQSVKIITDTLKEGLDA